MFWRSKARMIYLEDRRTLCANAIVPVRIML
jgi:hypothetical protein